MQISKISAQNLGATNQNKTSNSVQFKGNLIYQRLEPSSQWGNSISVADHYYKYVPEIKEKAAEIVAAVKKHLDDFNSGKISPPDEHPTGPLAFDRVTVNISIDKEHPNKKLTAEVAKVEKEYKTVLRDYLPVN